MTALFSLLLTAIRSRGDNQEDTDSQGRKDCGRDESLAFYRSFDLDSSSSSSGSDGDNDHQQRRDRGSHHDGHHDDQRLLGGALPPLGCGEIRNQGGRKETPIYAQILHYENILSPPLSHNYYRVTMVVRDYVLLTSIWLFHCLPYSACASGIAVGQDCGTSRIKSTKHSL